MTALLVILLVLLFVVIDVLVRFASQRMATARALKERKAILETGVQLSFVDELKTLKRAEVPRAKASILAVDDEPVVLDSFRKILVLAGFSVDTVEGGREALTLLRGHPYDFLFTDLKMPEMDGVEVVKAARHLRPDLDIVVITGYGTIETAVETMQHGAVDYVQKPFTEEELVAMANRLLVRRQARHEAQGRPTVRIVAPAMAETVAVGEFCVPGGAFVSPGHTWARIDPAGQVWMGLDDFARKALEKADRIELPADGARVKRGDILFGVRRGEDRVHFRAALSGAITQVNPELRRNPGLLLESPYDRGWVCLVRPSDLARELEGLRIGKPVVAWYQEEIVRLRAGNEGKPWSWAELEKRFLGPGVATTPPVTDAFEVTRTSDTFDV